MHFVQYLLGPEGSTVIVKEVVTNASTAGTVGVLILKAVLLLVAGKVLIASAVVAGGVDLWIGFMSERLAETISKTEIDETQRLSA